MAETGSFCCDDSRAIGERLAGTAPRSEVWLLLENPAPWSAQAVDESALPEAVKARLAGWLKAIPNARVQFIKQDHGHETRAFYVALASTGKLYRFDLADYESLLTLDIPALVGGVADYEARRSDERLFLVCTNGKRDACCARYGLPLYRQLREVGGEAVWQVNHIGGHRFAGTLVCLPHGLYYGRVGAAEPLIQAYRQGEFLTAGCRGRCTLEPAAQAAEIYLREQLGVYGLEAVQPMAVEQNGNEWTVQLAVDGQQYAVLVRGEGLSVLESSNDVERKTVMQPVPVHYQPVE